MKRKKNSIALLMTMIYCIGLTNVFVYADPKIRDGNAKTRKAKRKSKRIIKDGVLPTFKDVKYGSADNDVMNVWLVKSEKPTPVVVDIHGGGFTGGSRKKMIGALTLKQYQDARISYISIDYLFLNKRTTTKPLRLKQLRETLRHIARAIQFIRHNAKEWNIDPTLVGCTGNSAGAAASMWLAFHDDMADPNSTDPVLRQSTRISCADVGAVAGVSMDPLNKERLHLIETTPVKKATRKRLKRYGISSIEEIRDELETPEMKELRRDLGIIEWISPGDPPVVLRNRTPYDTYDGNVHNPHSIPVIKKYCDKAGVKCIPIMFNTPKEELFSPNEFLIGTLSRLRKEKKQ
ncbi:MAG: alpha/beta hydrolase [Planctomycetota bacterium]|jgi:hypothetical protein